MIVLDLDDFHESNNSLDRLFILKGLVPSLKVNLFTVPGLCSDGFLEAVRAVDWLDLIPHGYRHETSRECEKWTYSNSREYLEYVMHLGFTKGFKAPGWQISDGMYEALIEFGFWVADQNYNNRRRPAELRVYLLDQPWKIHGHIGHMGGHNDNELQYLWSTLTILSTEEFKFIKDIVDSK